MKRILLFGAGKSATVLIDYLLSHAAEGEWQLMLADANLQLAIQAFEDIMDNVASRGSPVSLVSEDEAGALQGTVLLELEAGAGEPELELVAGAEHPMRS